MRREPIKYKEILAMPGSELYTLLHEADKAYGNNKIELLKKAELSYKETETKDKKLLGETVPFCNRCWTRHRVGDDPQTCALLANARKL